MNPAAILSILVKADGIAKATTDLGKLDAAAKKTAVSTDKAGEAASSMAKKHGLGSESLKKAAMVSTVAMGAVAAGAVKMAADYQTSMNTLQAVSGATSSQMKELSKTAKQLGADTKLPGTSAKDAAQAMTEMVKAGVSVRDTMDGARSVLVLSAAAQIDNAKAAEIASNALNAFRLKGKDVQLVVDQLANTANSSSVEITDVADSFKMAAAVFNAFQSPTLGAKKAMTELNVAIGLLGNAGIKGSDAGTSLKQALLQLTGPSNKAKDAMRALYVAAKDNTVAQGALNDVINGSNKVRGDAIKALNKSHTNLGAEADIAYDATGKMRSLKDTIALVTAGTKNMNAEQRNAFLTQIFGADAVRSVTVLMQAQDGAWGKMEKSVNRTGAAQDLANAKMKGLNGAIESLRSTVETLAITFGTTLLPPLTAVFKAMADAGPVIEHNKALISILVGVLGTLAAATWAVNAAMAANPYVATAGAIAVLVSGLIVAYREIDAFRKVVDGAWAAVKAAFAQGISGVLQMFNGFKASLKGIIDVIAGIFTLDFDRIWKGVKEIFKGGVNVVVGIFKQMTAPLRAGVEAMDKLLSAAFGGTWDKIKKIFTDGVNAVIDFLNFLIGAINKIPGVNIGKIGKLGSGDIGKGNPNIPVDKKARGGAYARTGGLVNQPITLMGEEAPRYPEFVIPTNPAYRGRARGLLAQAAGAVGMASGGVFSQGDIMNLWTGQHGDPARKLIASAIAMAESGGRAGVTSPNPAGGSNLGLWQIWSGNPGATLDPAGNARAAINLSHNGANWGLWETFVNGAYKQFLGKGRAAGMAGGLPTVGDIVGSFPKVGTLPGLFQGLGKYVVGKATGYVKKQVEGLFQGQGNLGNKGVDSGLSIGVRKAIDLASGLGWAYPSPGQLTSGGHAQGSLHYQGRAVDFGTAGHSSNQVMGLWQALINKFGLGINELFYDPAGRYIDAHKWHSGAIGGHGDHIHVGFRKGGKWLGSFKNGGVTGAEGLAHLHKNEMVVPLKKGGKTLPKGPKVKPGGGPFGKALVSIGGGRYVTVEQWAQMIANGYDPSDTSRNFGPAFTQTPSAAGTASDEAVSENTDAIDEQNALLARQNDLLAEQNANQLKILALANQGPQILAAVVAAVNGGIGGNVGLGFQSPSSSGQMARYR